MDTYLSIALQTLGIAGTVGAAARWALISYLKDKFASKQDLHRLETKIDSLVDLHWATGSRARRRPPTE